MLTVSLSKIIGVWETAEMVKLKPSTRKVQLLTPAQQLEFSSIGFPLNKSL
jgi:hypothetical protein